MIVVTGGAGFIGSALVWKLRSENLRDLVVVDQNVDSSAKGKNIAKHRNLEWIPSSAFLSKLEEGHWKGKISAVFGGEISRSLDGPRLMKFLQRNLEPEKKLESHPGNQSADAKQHQGAV